MRIKGFGGQLLGPRDAGYDQSRRVWNGLIDAHPALIARCYGAGDVAAAIRHARDQGLPVAVRGGGHGVAGTAVCDGGLVVDCSPMRAVTVDPGSSTVRAGAGCLWGHVDTATQRYGLAVPGGIVSHTGIAGLTLGGGIGWLMRSCGLTADNLLAADLVTAAGERLRSSPASHEELFWALRGGGGNFGVVTEFSYRAHPAGPVVLAGPVAWPLEDAVEVLRSYRDWISGVPDELTTIVKLARVPAGPAIRPDLHGRPAVIISCCYAGPPDDGLKVLEPMRRIAQPLFDQVVPRPYLENQQLNDPTVPHGWYYYWKSAMTAPLDNDLIDVLVAHTGQITSPRSYTLIFQLGGSIARVPEDATAYRLRGAAHAININAVWLPGDTEAVQHIEWTRKMFAAIEPYQQGVYVNFLGAEGAERVRQAYGHKTHARLAAVKADYDPDNVFALNQNIPPSRQAAVHDTYSPAQGEQPRTRS
jgi:FAD/FMN-containing dehydrogenase